MSKIELEEIEAKIYRFVCPVCRKQIRDSSRARCLNQARQHMMKHELQL